jgi:dUTP pyrophosphatase
MKSIFDFLRLYIPSVCCLPSILFYSFINNISTFKVKLHDVSAKMPKKAEPGSAGYDIFSNEHVIVPSGSRKLISTGVSIEVPDYYYVRVAPRSGLACKGIDIGAGVVDSSYRGEVKVLIINNGSPPFEIKNGDKIAQLILERCGNAKIELADTLGDTLRGSGGFGSTGN